MTRSKLSSSMLTAPFVAVSDLTVPSEAGREAVLAAFGHRLGAGFRRYQVLAR